VSCQLLSARLTSVWKSRRYLPDLANQAGPVKGRHVDFEAIPGISIEALVTYRVFMILAPICINFTVSRKAVLSMLGWDWISPHGGISNGS
jgi:hypothetical protein